MAKSAKLRNDISGFRQLHDEPLYEAWERYKDLLRRCPQHQLPKWMIMQTFYNGLHGNTQTMIDATAGGSMNNKKPAEVYELIKAMASNNYERGGDHQRKNAGVLDVDEMTALKAQLAAMQKQMSKMQVNAAQVPMLVCELCAGRHATLDCQVGNTFGQQEQVNFANNFQRGQGNSYDNPYPHAYNPNWRTTHPNLSWGNNSNQQPQYPQQQQPRNEQQQKSGVEELLTKYIEGNEKRLESNDMLLKNQSASIKNLEMQMGQIHNLLANRQQGTLPSDTEKNPREQVNAITLRSGTTYAEPRVKVVPNEVVKRNVVPEEKGKEMEAEEEQARAKEEKEREKARVDEGVKRYQEKYDRLPFPGRLKKQTDDIHYRKFLEMFRGLHINIPFADVLEQMPRYAKYLKEMITKKRKWAEHETVMLTEESSALLRKKLPPKLSDPGSFSISCMIGSLKFENALCDLGASVNILPYSLFKKLNIGEVKPTKISLQLADRSIIYPRGIVLIKVDKFIFPIDLIVLDMEEDKSIPLILGRPFLATTRAVIDVGEGKLILKLGDDQIEFNFCNNMKYPPEVENCMMIKTTNEPAVA